MKKSLASKLDELSKIGLFRTYTLEERLLEYQKELPVEFRDVAVKEAIQYNAKGLVCNEFKLINGSVEEVIQWQTPSKFIANCYEWFIRTPESKP